MEKLKGHRNLLGRVLAAGDELDTMRPGWLEMMAGYESLDRYLNGQARPAPRQQVPS